MSSATFDLLNPKVQKAVWSMGWKEFRPIQVKAIHQVLEQSGHLIITAQTAGGKTEAAFLPIISKLVDNPQLSIQALYVGPLKALINDQFERMEKLCDTLDIPVHRWHGDVSASRKKELRQSPAGILLITPESIESNFVNYGSQIPRLYRYLEFVVIDELHSFLDNVRGVHLLSLLARLRQATALKPRIIALSATLGDPQAGCRFLSPDRPDAVSLIEDPSSQREIKFGIRVHLRRPLNNSEKLIEPRLKPAEALQIAERLTTKDLQSESPCGKENTPELSASIRKPGHDPDDELDEIAEDLVHNFARSTNLVFVNAKSTIEKLAVKLHDHVKLEKLANDPFVVHHGSISKQLREEAEVLLKSGTPTTAICSSTLEMGIDIGGVQAIGQVDTPWSVASLVQRLGRSGRRDGDAAIMRLYVRETSPHFGSRLTDLLYPDLLRAIALTRLMLKHWLEPPDIDRMHLSTLIHQLLSCLKQTGGITASQIFETLIKIGPFRLVTARSFTELLKGLGQKEIIEQVPQGELILAPLGEKITSSYDFYAAFKGTEEFVIRDGNEDIGNLPVNRIPPVGEHIILAGRRWKIEEIDAAAKTVFVSPTRGGKAPEFLGAGGELHTRVLHEMRAVLREQDEPPWLNENAKLLLRGARSVALKCGVVENDVLFTPRRVQWFPWVGSRGLLTLKVYADAMSVSHEVDKLSITYHVDSPEKFFNHLEEIANSPAQANELVRFIPVKTIQKYDDLLPDDLLDIANGHDYLDLNEAKDVSSQTLQVHSRAPNRNGHA
ncbi:MAG TPA: DEAD/DEAH box helicase [Verrucomicrobiae bacterium]|jgi:ATP-dependent Lhr-like helicase|nr:DEAD/DEAH box helicase [Verrucomicrobiae bacterium]